MAATDEVQTAIAPEDLFNSVVSIFTRFYPDAPTDRFWQAFELATAAHEGQVRQTGEQYITHPLIVAEILADYGLDEATLLAAILHDVVEDSDYTLEQIEEQFGEEVALLIDGVTKLDRIKFSTREEQQAATIRKMAIAMAKDIRVLLIKLVDRLHNVRTLAPLSPEKQERIASETLDVYAPLAHRLGVQEIKHELEERCFDVLYPKRKRELEDLVRHRAGERQEYIDRAMQEV